MLGFIFYSIATDIRYGGFPVDWGMLSTAMVIMVILVGISIVLYFVEYYLIIVYRGVIKPKIKGRK